jgi:isoquinoline 1-oxidoreductase subunit beta
MPDIIGALRDRRGLSRRQFLKAGAAGTLVVGFRLPVARADVSVFAPNAFIRLAEDGRITLIMPQVEMGQGVYTGIAMILADEMDADFIQVALEHAPPNDVLYANPIFGIQATGGSTSIRAFWAPLRKAGATARVMLVTAAAQQWNVEPSTCRTSNSQVVHNQTRRTLPYGALAASAAQLTPPKDAVLKAVKDFTLIGKPLKRLDTPDKVNGKGDTASTRCRQA